MDKRAFFKKLMPYLGLGFFGSVVESLFFIAILMTILDRLPAPFSDFGPQGFTVLLLGLFAAVIVSKIVIPYVFFKYALRVKAVLHGNFRNRVLFGPYSDVIEYSSGDVSTVTQQIEKVVFFVLNVRSYITSLVIAILLIVVLAYLSPYFLVAFLVALTAFGLSLKKMFQASFDFNAAETRVNARRNNTLSGMIRLSAETRLGPRLRGYVIKTHSHLFHLMSRAHTNHARSYTIWQTLAFVSIMSFILAIMLSAIWGVTEFVEVYGVLITLAYATPQLMGLSNFYTEIARLRQAMSILDELSPLTPFERIDFGTGLYPTRISYSDFAADVDYKRMDQKPVSLTLNRGEVLYLVGPNGVGKTTLLKALIGLLPAKGQAAFTYASGEQKAATAQDLRETFAVSFVQADYGGMEIEPDIKHEMKMHAGDVNLNLLDNEALDFNKLSSGQSRRIGILMALMERRSVIALDEPCANQSEEYKNFFYKEFVPTMLARGKTLLIVTHDQEFVDEDKCLVLGS